MRLFTFCLVSLIYASHHSWFTETRDLNAEQLSEELEHAKSDLQLNSDFRFDSQTRHKFANHLRQLVPKTKAFRVEDDGASMSIINLEDFISSVTSGSNKRVIADEGYSIILRALQSGIGYNTLRERLRLIAISNQLAVRRSSKVIHLLRDRIKEIRELLAEAEDISG